ncbi:hypothetical protein [Arthrobacter sp. NPDC090010]|uniref:hypothetical protein n=1 Tax=Arthrobacter sp. NPDC090010 TaxID=3363942 RepID=UPI0038051959
MSTPEFNPQGQPTGPGPQDPGQNPGQNPWAQQAQGNQTPSWQAAPQPGAAQQPGVYGGWPQHGGPAGHPGLGQSTPPSGGKAFLGPFTLRDVLVLLAIVLLVIAGGFSAAGSGLYFLNLQLLVMNFIFPLAVAAGFVVRRVSPTTKIRLGSFSLDQMASVLASFALLSLVGQLGYLTSNLARLYFNVGDLVFSILGTVLLFLTTVLARFIPVFAADFTGREETVAHVVARDGVPAARSAAPGQAPMPVQQYPSTPGYGSAHGAPTSYAPQGASQQFAPGQGAAPLHGGPAQAAATGAPGQSWTVPVAAPLPSGSFDAGQPGDSGPVPATESAAPQPSSVTPAAQETAVPGTAAEEGLVSAVPGAETPVHSGSDAREETADERPETPERTDGEKPESPDAAVSEHTTVGDTPVDEAGTDDLNAAAPDAGTDEVDGLLEEAESHIAQAPELPEPVLGEPTLSEDSLDEPTATELEEDPDDVTVLRSALLAELNQDDVAQKDAGPAQQPGRHSAPDDAAAQSQSQSQSDSTQPQTQQAFWFAVPDRRPVVDERTGAPVFDALPGKWILALQEGPHGLVVQNEDGRIGLLQDIRNIERGS